MDTPWPRKEDRRLLLDVLALGRRVRHRRDPAGGVAGRHPEGEAAPPAPELDDVLALGGAFEVRFIGNATNERPRRTGGAITWLEAQSADKPSQALGDFGLFHGALTDACFANGAVWCRDPLKMNDALRVTLFEALHSGTLFTPQAEQHLFWFQRLTLGGFVRWWLR